MKSFCLLLTCFHKREEHCNSETQWEHNLRQKFIPLTNFYNMEKPLHYFVLLYIELQDGFHSQHNPQPGQNWESSARLQRDH